jgi:N-acylneuraminate cytidylyltransferase
MKRSWAIIPARKGSKGIKNKNLTQINGKSLVRIAVDQAQQAGIFDGIIITTDYFRSHLGIDDVNHKVPIYFIQRPPELCTDTAKMKDVIKHAIVAMGGKTINWLWVLQPCSPFRKKEDFKAINTALKTGEWVSAISFKPIKEHPNRSYTYKNGQAWPLRHVNYDNKEDLMPMLTRSGNFYVVDKDKFLEKDKLEIRPFFSHIMGGIDPSSCSREELRKSRQIGTNLDDQEDMELFKGIIRRGDVTA